MNSILILAAFFPGNAGFNYRSKKWAEELNKNGFKVDILYVFESNRHRQLTIKNSLITFQFYNVFIRFIHVLKSIKYDRIIVRRSLLQFNDYGFLFLDKLLLSLHPKAILDFDDDLSNNLKKNTSSSLFGKLLFEDRLIFYQSLKIYKKFMPGSEYLKILLKNTNNNVSEGNILVLPTCVDYLKYPAKVYHSNKEIVTLGWIGSNVNQEQLDPLIPILNSISEKSSFELLVISGKPYKPEGATFQIRNVQWSLETEKEDLYQIDLGLMPLINDKMSRAKCGFKLIQYMGLGIVSVASAVTTNNRIISDNEDGFLVKRIEDWPERFLEIMNKRKDFGEISKKAREKVRKHYSFEAHIENLIKFIKQ